MTSLRLLGAAVAGVGGGLLIATVVDAATVVGVVVLAAVVAFGWRSGSDGEAIGVETPAGAAPPVRQRARPTLTGLPTRVEQILRLAEEQAAEHVAEAKQQGQAIVAAAHEEARAVRARVETPDA